MIRRIAFTALVTGVLVLSWAGAASAHVTVDPPSAPQGGTVKLSFLAPNEEPPATVTELQIFFPVPPATPIPTVTVEPKAGWTFKLTMLHLTNPLVTDDGSISDIVSEIDWKAVSPADAIGANEFGEFTIDADGLPDSGTQVVFKALQTYSNGDIVRWIEPVPATGDAPEHPTPILQLTNPNGTPAASAPAATASTAGLAKKSQVDSARTVGVIGIVIGALGLIAAGVALLTARRGKRPGPVIA
jgi:uncharacterized protein